MLLKDSGVIVPGINNSIADGKPDIGVYEMGQPRWDKVPNSPKIPAGLLELVTLIPW